MLPAPKVDEQLLRRILAAWFKLEEWLDLDYPLLDGFDLLVNREVLRLPCSPYKLFVVPARLAIFSDVQRAKKSLLVNYLQERSDEVGLTVDALHSGKDAVFLTALCPDPDSICRWIGCMDSRRIELKTQPINDETLIIAPLRNFVVHQVVD